MPSPQPIPFGAPCWIDLLTSDADASRAFYGELLGWTAEDPNPDYGGYFNFAKDDGRVAGAMAKQPEMEAPDGWSVYLAVVDAEATVATATARGSQVIVPAMAVGELGHMAVVTDPGGASIGIWQPGEHKGFAALAEPGAPSWFELHTRSYEESVAFYQDVFGWQTTVASDEADFRYTTMQSGSEEPRAGVMDAAAFLPEGVPSHWSVYFGVADIDDALAKVKDLGGTVGQGPDDTPYGKLATIVDTTGANAKLVQPPTE